MSLAKLTVTTHSRFNKQVKKLHKQDKKELDNAIMKILAEPNIGESKVGDLNGVRVYKFKIKTQQVLLAYMHLEEENSVYLLSFGPHENFYRDLKKVLN